MNERLSSHLNLTLLSIKDIPAALSLCRHAGWNQTEQDWLRFLRMSPASCFGVVQEQTCVATCIITEYAGQQAWIGMMLVHPDYRRRGLATKLMGHCLEQIENLGIECVRLDATPAGRQVYQDLGFVDEFELSRWHRPGPVTNDHDPSSRVLDQNDIHSYLKHLEVDRRAFGTDRSMLLERLDADSTTYSLADGFGMIRPGYLANYLGPLTATNQQDAHSIAQRLVDLTPSPIFWDIPDSQIKTTQFARSLGFQKQRSLTRMRRGPNVPQDVRLIYGISGPSTG